MPDTVPPSNYVVFLGGNVFGLVRLETFGTLAVEDFKKNDWSIVKLNFNFKGEYSHLLGTSWLKYKSSGILERTMIENMFFDDEQ